MNIFNDIKEGILPDEKTLLYVFENKIIDLENKEEIKKYIEVLNNAYNDSTIEEKILLNRVIFILELLIQKKDALKNFILKAFTLNIHDIDQDYSDFLSKVLLSADENELFKIFQELLKDIYKLPKEDMRSFFNWLLHKVWNLPKFYSSNEFTKFYPILQQLLDILKKQNRIDDMMYVEFFTYHIMGNNFQSIDEWREFNEKITKKTISAYEQFIPQLPKANSSKKSTKRIAFIKDRIVFNSPYQVEYSLFKSLIENKEFTDTYELIIYSFNQFEKSEDDENLVYSLEKLGLKVKNPVKSFQIDGYYNNHLDKALTMRQALIDDDIDIMIAGTGVFPIVNFLFVTRTAPLQIYYSHGNCAYDVPNIDKRMSHFHQECKEFEWNIINIPLDKQFLVGTEGEKVVAQIIKNDYKNKFGDDVVILGTIGRLVKIDNDEYIQTIAKIMKDNPNTIYLACGTGNEESIKEKLKKYEIDEKRFIFTGHVKAHVYGWVIDVWPDSFPHWQGQSAEEFRVKGGILIRKKVESKPTYDEFEQLLISITLKDLYKGNKNKVKDIENYNFPIKYKKLLKESLEGNKISFILFILHLAFPTNEKYIEAINLFVKNKKLIEMARNMDIEKLLESGGHHMKNIDKFLEIIKDNS